MRRNGSLVLVVLAGGAVAAGCGSASAASDSSLAHVAASAPTVSVFPSPGTKYATEQTQISIRGASASAIGSVTVTGSKSGAHAGRIEQDSDGKGASFLPDKPFAAGEKVTVRTHLNVRGGKNGAYTIGIETPGAQEEPTRALPVISSGSGVEHFASEPSLAPAKVTASKAAGKTAAGDFFLGITSSPGFHGPGQVGPMLLDSTGKLVWFKPLSGTDIALDVREQTYQGKPVITWWQGFLDAGTGAGDGVIYDTSYRQIADVRAGNGLRVDPHEFRLLPDGTALIVADNPVIADTSKAGGAKKAVVYDDVVQRIDVKTGLVEYEWHSLDHVPVTDSYAPPVRTNGHIDDYFHMNSVTTSADGDYVVSGRNTWGVYRLDKNTGAVAWTLGGKHSTFRQAKGSTFAWQHDVGVQPDGTISIFDDGASPAIHTQSNGITVRINTNAKTAALVKNYVQPGKMLANSQGSLQILPNDDALIGWGSEPLVSEFAPHGQLLTDLDLPRGDESYRAYKYTWNATPSTPPALAAKDAGVGKVRVSMSWNGATNVASWEVLAGADASSLAPVQSVTKSNFETSATVSTTQPMVEVQAKDSSGKVIGTSAAVTPTH